MTAKKPTLTARERKLANRAAGGRANAETTAWVTARRESPGLTLREFQLREAGDLDPLEGTAPSSPVGAAAVPVSTDLSREDLRAEADRLGLSTRGTKAELVDRITETSSGSTARE